MEDSLGCVALKDAVPKVPGLLRLSLVTSSLPLICLPDLLLRKQAVRGNGVLGSEGEIAFTANMSTILSTQDPVETKE